MVVLNLVQWLLISLA